MENKVMPFSINMDHAATFRAPLPARADVVIIGGGIIGITTAWFLARMGLRPLVLEKGRVAGEQSARNWGWIRQTGRDLAELPIMMEAVRLWPELAALSGEDIGLRPSGVCFLAERSDQIAGYEAWRKDAGALGVDSRILSRADVADMHPGVAQDWHGGLWTGSDLTAEPFLAVPAFARAAVRDGALIREGCAVRLLETRAGRVGGVITEDGVVATDKVLVAGGAWSSLFLRRHGVSIPQLSVRSSVLRTAPLPEVGSAAAGGHRLAWRRRPDGGYTLAPSGFYEFWIGPDAVRALPHYRQLLMSDPFGPRYRPWAPRGYPDAWTTARRWGADGPSPFEACRILDPSPNRAAQDDVVARFERAFPHLGKVKVAGRWAGMIDTMPDVVPVADAVAEMPGLTVCTGMCGHGFGIGPGFGRIMADIIAGRDPGHDLSRFRIDRFRGFPRLEIGPDL